MTKNQKNNAHRTRREKAQRDDEKKSFNVKHMRTPIAQKPLRL